MSEVLPISWLIQASVCNVKIGMEIVVTTVTDREAIMNSSISELKSVLKSTPDPFVGIDVVNNGDLLLLHVKKRCLIIQFNRMMVLDNLIDIPNSLQEFLRDKTITFIGPGNINQNSTVSYISGSSGDKLVFNRVVDVRYLTGKLCKKPNLLSSTLEELLGEVDIDIKKPVISEGSMRPNWQSSSILSEEEVKLAMYEVHVCYQIASKLITDATSATAKLLPLSWLVQLSSYNVKIGDETIITIVADRLAIMNSSISELKSVLKSIPDRFVGIDVINNGDLLLFYVKNLCLMIQFKRMMILDNLIDLPLSLKEFLWDKTITFIGPRNIIKKSTISHKSGGDSQDFQLDRIVDVGYLVAKLRKKPNLLSSTLEELLGEVDIDIKKPVISEGSMRPNWQSSSILSEEEVKLAMYEVHVCYQIASKLITDATSATAPRA